MVVRIGSRSLSRSAEDLSDALAAAYREKTRPICLCTQSGVEMYIAKINSNFYLKRMPNSGGKHRPTCDSYEPPAEISGLSEVVGRAIQEDVASGETTVKLAFALSKTGKRGPIAGGSDTEKTSAKSDGSKLTARGLLHYLWNEAGFNRWVSGMTGKRNWFVIRKHLKEAAEGKTAKGMALAQMLFIPETFSVDRKADIEARRRKCFHEAFGNTKGKVKHLMLLIAEIKEFSNAHSGQRMLIKHLPDTPFLLEQDLVKRIASHFESELQRWHAAEDTHLITLATFEVTDAGVPCVHEMVLMNVSSEWIPFDSTDEKVLIDTLCHHKRHFVKGLRFNLPSHRPIAAAVLSDTGTKPTALYVIPSNASETLLEDVNSMTLDSDLAAWIWDARIDSMPTLPSVVDT